MADARIRTAVVAEIEWPTGSQSHVDIKHNFGPERPAISMRNLNGPGIVFVFYEREDVIRLKKQDAEPVHLRVVIYRYDEPPRWGMLW